MAGDKSEPVRLVEPDNVAGKVDQVILFAAVAGRNVGTVDRRAPARKRKAFDLPDHKAIVLEKVVVVVVAQIALVRGVHVKTLTGLCSEGRGVDAEMNAVAREVLQHLHAV